MAMIQCPECGNQVSDKAANCIHCGCPINVSKRVKIKLPLIEKSGKFMLTPCDAEVFSGGKAVWRGQSGTVASFDIEANGAANIIFRQVPAGPFGKTDFAVEGNIEMGKSYEVKRAGATSLSAIGANPSKYRWILSEVDVIDSGM